MLLVLQLECIKKALLLIVYCTQLGTLAAYITLFLLAFVLHLFLAIELNRPALGKNIFLYLFPRFAHLLGTDYSQQTSYLYVRKSTAVTQHHEYSLMSRHSDMSNVHS